MNLFITRVWWLLAIAILPILVSCVGKIEDPQDKIQNYTQVNFNFAGAVSGKAVAHDKVRISFAPATGGSGKFNYLVYLNGNKLSPVASLASVNSIPDSKNLLHVTVKGLVKDTENAFVVNAQDTADLISDFNNNEVVVKTLDYEVPDFGGITSLNNLSGSAGKTQLLAKWNVASPSSVDPNSFFGSDPNAISGYTVYVGTTEENMAVKDYVDDPNATSFLITGLDINQNYFVNVRARNSASPQVEDLNLEYRSRKTLTSQAISFAGLATASIPTNITGFSRINLSWKVGSGDFDRYRVYYSTTPVESFDPSSILPNLDITDLSSLSTAVTGLTANTQYYVAVVACRKNTLDDFCASYEGHNVVKTVTTQPPVAPFAGIKTISQSTGLAGLTQMILTWDAPNTSFGVYDKIDIFRVVAGVVDPTPLSTYSGSGLGKILSLTSSTGTVIDGAVVGTNYCFLAKAYSGVMTHANEKVVCYTPTMTNPGFNGLANTGCSHIANTTSVALSWSVPNPIGIFSSYEIYYRPLPGSGAFDFSDAIANANAVSSEYKMITASSSAITKTITGLSPGISYEFGMKTYFQNPITAAITRVGLDAAICTVAIPESKILHKGWEEIFAVGPKRNGLTGEIITERIRMSGDTEFYHRVPMEDDAATLGVTGSQTGIVRLTWNDFEFYGLSKTLYNYKDLPNTGYNIYRIAYDSNIHSATFSPTLNSPSWIKLNSSTIPPKLSNTYKFGEWIDYTAGATQRAGGTNLNKVETYWYKVEPVLNGSVVSYQNDPSDGVVKVLLPPVNKALVHRWMANKVVCSDMQRTFDRAKHYRCSYNGLASKVYEVEGVPTNFYDYGGHLLVDRFELGVKFSRGNSSTPCGLTGSNTNAYFIWEGATTDASKGKIAGDCIGYSPSYNALISGSGYGNPNGAPGFNGPDRITGSEGSVYYNRNISSTSENLVYIYRNSRWRMVNRADSFPATWGGILEASSVAPSSSVLPPTVPGVTTGAGLATVISTNDAKVPPLGKLSQSTAYKLCMGHSFSLRGRTFYNRLVRRREYVVANALPSPNLLSASSAENISDDNLGTKGCYTRVQPISVNDHRLRSTDFATLNLNDEKYPNTGTYTASYRLTIYNTGSDATSNCVSRFGLQDSIGGFGEWNSDNIWCDRINSTGSGSTNLTNGMCSARYKNLSPGVTPTDIFNPPWDQGNVANLRNGDGQYYNQGEGDDIFGINPKKIIPGITGWNYMTMNGIIGTTKYHESEFFNVALGFPLQCSGTACGDSTKDDNVRVSTRSADQLTSAANTPVVNFSFNSDRFWHYLTNQSTVFNTTQTNIHQNWGLLGSLAFDLSTTGQYSGRWSHDWRGYIGGDSSWSTGARCGVLVEENEDGELVDADGTALANGSNNMNELL